MEIIPIQGKKSYNHLYRKNKKNIGIDSRDFYDKSVQFWDDGKFYIYNGSAASKSKEIPDKTVRGKTIFNCTIYQKGPDERIYGICYI